VSRSFELLQLPYVWTIQQPVRRTLSVLSSFRISFQTQIWEDCCNRSDDVDSCPDALIHKASIAIQIQTSGRQSAWSGHGCIRLTVRTPFLLVRTRGAFIWKLLAADVRPSRRQCLTVWTWLSNRKDFQRNFLEFRSHSCLSGRPMTTVRTAPSFIKPDYLNC
jgi:hypothetical protein